MDVLTTVVERLPPDVVERTPALDLALIVQMTQDVVQ